MALERSYASLKAAMDRQANPQEVAALRREVSTLGAKLSSASTVGSRYSQSTSDSYCLFSFPIHRMMI